MVKFSGFRLREFVYVVVLFISLLILNLSTIFLFIDIKIRKKNKYCRIRQDLFLRVYGFSEMKDKYAKHLISVGKKLRAYRLANAWSQEMLASRCDTVNAAKISKMENARENYNFSTLLEVCDALEVDVSIIVQKEE